MNASNNTEKNIFSLRKLLSTQLFFLLHIIQAQQNERFFFHCSTTKQSNTI